MTWLELIDELRKQPLYLLERDVSVWCNVGSEDSPQFDYVVAPVVELTSPLVNNDLLEWVDTPEYSLSIVVDLKVDDLKRLRGMKE